MRVLAASLLALLSIVDLAKLQAAEPQFRPAMIGNGPKALVNVINTKRLVEKGQRDGLLMFTCHVNPSGKVQNYFIYRETPGSKLLKEEAGHAIWDCRFIPAIYNGERTEVGFAGTVVFSVSDGKPHLRIYANQSNDDIKKGNDFIAPQVLANTVLRSNSDFVGTIQLSITVDANGNQKDLKVILEDPSGSGFGHCRKGRICKGEMDSRFP